MARIFAIVVPIYFFDKSISSEIPTLTLDRHSSLIFNVYSLQRLHFYPSLDVAKQEFREHINSARHLSGIRLCTSGIIELELEDEQITGVCHFHGFDTVQPSFRTQQDEAKWYIKDIHEMHLSDGALAKINHEYYGHLHNSPTHQILNKQKLD